LPQYKQ